MKDVCVDQKRLRPTLAVYKLVLHCQQYHSVLKDSRATASTKLIHVCYLSPFLLSGVKSLHRPQSVLAIVASSHVNLVSEHTRRGPRTRVCQPERERERENSKRCKVQCHDNVYISLAEVLPAVGFGQVAFNYVIVSLAMPVSPSNGVDIAIVDDSCDAGARVPHVGTEVPAVLYRVVALHGGVVDGAILTSDYIQFPVHCASAGARTSDVHVRDSSP